MRRRTTSPGGRLMDLHTAAAYLGCSYWTLRDLVLAGHIPAVRIPRRLASITTANVNAFILKRQKDVMVVGEDDEREERRYSNGEINRELTTLKRILNLARQNGKLVHVPYVPMLKERNVRTGFFEREQIDRMTCDGPPCATWCAPAFPSASPCR